MKSNSHMIALAAPKAPNQRPTRKEKLIFVATCKTKDIRKTVLFQSVNIINQSDLTLNHKRNFCHIISGLKLPMHATCDVKCAAKEETMDI